MTKDVERKRRPARSGFFTQDQLIRLSQDLSSLKEETEARLEAMKAIGVDGVAIDGTAMAVDGLIKIKTTLSRK